MTGRARKSGTEPARRGLGGEQVEGRQAVRELLRAGKRRVSQVWLAQEAQPAPVLDQIAALAVERGATLRRVSRSRLDQRAGTDAPQGVVAFAEPLAESRLDELCQRAGAHAPPFLLAMDGVTDPQNLGAMLRTAAAAGVTGVVLPRHRSVHVTPAVTKAAAGAVEDLPMALVGGMPGALTAMRREGLWVVGLDPHAPDSLFGLGLATEPLALVLGAEGPGLSPLVRRRCDALVHIPVAGPVASLNVAAAAAIACFEVGRHRPA